MKNRYQVFVEDEEGEGAGAVMNCQTIEDVWVFMELNIVGEGERLVWVKDRKTAQVHAELTDQTMFCAVAETPGVLGMRMQFASAAVGAFDDRN